MDIYKITIGLLDKDSKKQEVDTYKAIELLKTMSAEAFEGATLYEAQGVYKHLTGEVITEPSVIVEVATDMKDSIMNFIKDAKEKFNQETVMLSKQTIECSFI